jgi:hypothetical protein
MQARGMRSTGAQNGTYELWHSSQGVWTTSMFARSVHRSQTIQLRAESALMPETDKVIMFGIVIMLLAHLALWFPSGPRDADRRR